MSARFIDTTLDFLETSTVAKRFVGFIFNKEWDESLHPRDERGRFGESSEGETEQRIVGGVKVDAEGKVGGVKPAESDNDIERFLADVEKSPEYIEVNERLQQYGATAQERSTWSQRQNQENDVYTNQDKHDQITKGKFPKETIAREGEKPILALTTGAPGSGKSTSAVPEAEKLLGEGRQYGGLSSDEIKYQLGAENWNVGAYHEESSDIADKQAFDFGLSNRANMLLDVTGSNTGKMEKFVRRAVEAGYEVHVYNVAVPDHVSANRAWARFAKNDFSGRYVPPAYAFKVDKQPDVTYEHLQGLKNEAGNILVPGSNFHSISTYKEKHYSSGTKYYTSDNDAQEMCELDDRRLDALIETLDKHLAKKPIKSNKAFWTSNRKLLAWKKYDREAQAYEPLFKRVAVKFFRDVNAQVQDNLEKHGIKVKSNIGAMCLNGRQKWLADHKDRLNEFVPSKNDLKKQLKTAMRPVYLSVIEKAGNGQMEELAMLLPKKPRKDIEADVEMEFDLNDPQVQKWIGERLEEFSETTAQTTIDDTKRVLREDFENGEPLMKMGEHLRDYYEGAETYRANLIARTESTSAMCKGDLEAVRQMDLEGAVGKIWLAEPDSSTRETHTEAGERYSDGYDAETRKIMNIDDEFEVGDDKMLHPAGGQLAEENCNCRCGMVYEPVEPQGQEEEDDEEKSFPGHVGRPRI